MPTKARIANKVLTKLTVIGEGDTAIQTDVDLVEETYDEVWEELSELGMVTWGEDDEIPTEASKSIVYLVAAELVDEYEVPPQKAANIQQGAARAEVTLRRLVTPDYVSAPTKFVDY
ncbi:hypothetical protein KAR91_12840 [Candidatus Pacearchaeota archaeon]|nr:hypothetical protein [Candidatus Pacearchaeota archaeon]